MGHLTKRPSDTVRVGAWWYRDYDEYLDTKAEYDQDERYAEREDDRDDEDTDEGED